MNNKQIIGGGLVLLGILIIAILLCGVIGRQKSNSLEEWQKKITKLTGSDSVESRTLSECAEGMKSKIEECSKNEGWMVDNQLSITDFKTKENYEIEDIKQGGCKGLGPNDTRPFTVDSKFLDAQSESNATSFQIVCKIACYSWPCEKTSKTGNGKEEPKEEKYSLTIKKTGSGSGIVSSDTINCGDNCKADFNKGEYVAISAESEKGSVFLGWEGACTGTDNYCYLDMNENQEATAIFGKASITFSGTCKLLNIDNWGDHHWSVDVSGEATAPEGFELSFGPEVSGYESPENKCDSWGESELQICKRNPGEPETTGFVHIVDDMTERPDFRMFGYKYIAYARLFYKNNLVTEEEIEFQCPS